MSSWLKFPHLLALWVGLLACGESRDASSARSAPLLVDQTAELGVDFVHRSGRTGNFYMPEIMGSGAALLDVEGDGDLDLYLVQGGSIDQPSEHGDRLFVNQLAESGELSFRDATEASGLVGNDYGMGAAVADVDGDGDNDLFVTNWGADRLWLNRGNGVFDETPGPWTEEQAWSVSAVFVDVDEDGRLDLFVTRYLDFGLDTHKICPTSRGEDDYCGPITYRPLRDRLYRNLGDGRFEDVSIESGVGVSPGSGLGAVAVDVDRDGRMDLFVANDKMPNFLWLNEGGGRFRAAADEWGCGVNRDGLSEAGMGVDAGDIDGDGDDDLFLVHLAGESHTLYRNESSFFTDVTTAAGIVAPSLPVNGFGAVLADVDLDGWLDALVAAGHVHRLPHLVQAGDPFPYHQPGQWLRGLADGTFEDVTESLGGDLASSRVGRGLAVGDLDNDGDLDAVMTVMDDRPAVLINTLDPDSWIGVRAVEPSGADALGARILFEFEGRQLWRRVDSGGSYASARDPRILLPLSDGVGEASVSVSWPDGTVERFGPLEAARYHRLERLHGEIP